MARMRLGVYLGEGHKLGPGKIQLLEAVREHGSISGAARSMGMAYRHAWVMIDELNRCFRSPVVEASTGGREGGGARLTPFGEELVASFRSMERAARSAIGRDLDALDAQVAAGGRTRPARPTRPRAPKT